MKWSIETSSQFNVLNGVKQGGILSHCLFAVYLDDGLLDRFRGTGIDCHMVICFVGELACADDLNLLYQTLSGLKVLVDVCQKYAEDYNINFNGRFYWLKCKTSKEVTLSSKRGFIKVVSSLIKCLSAKPTSFRLLIFN